MLNPTEIVCSILKNAAGPLSTKELKLLLSQTAPLESNFVLTPNAFYSRVKPRLWGLLERDFVLNLFEQKNLKDYIFLQLTKNSKIIYKHDLLQVTKNLQLPAALNNNHIYGILITDDRFKIWHGRFVCLANFKESDDEAAHQQKMHDVEFCRILSQQKLVKKQISPIKQIIIVLIVFFAILIMMIFILKKGRLNVETQQH